MHVLGTLILDKLTITGIILQKCKSEVQTPPEETNLLCTLTSTKTQVTEFSKKSICSIFILKCEVGNASSYLLGDTCDCS